MQRRLGKFLNPKYLKVASRDCHSSKNGVHFIPTDSKDKAFNINVTELMVGQAH